MCCHISDSRLLVRAYSRGIDSTTTIIKGIIRYCLCSNPTLGSYAGNTFLLDSSCWPCHGRFVRCGDTRTHDPFKGLYRRCDISSRIASGIVRFGEVGTESGGVGREAELTWLGKSVKGNNCTERMLGRQVSPQTARTNE